jgi:anti-anti-sigma factor
MSQPTVSKQGEFFQLQRRGDVVIMLPSPNIEDMVESLIDPSAKLVLQPLLANPPSGLVVDLTQVDYFGSLFVRFLLRCHEFLQGEGIEMVLAGVSEKCRELLHVMNLDTLWAIYDTLNEAVEVFDGA